MGPFGLQILVLTLVVQSAAPNAPNGQPEPEAVKSILREYAKACEGKDLGAVSSLFSHDPDIVVINAGSPRRVVGWQRVAGMYKALFSASGEAKMRHENITIKMLASGKAACLVCDQDVSGTYQGRGFAIKGVRVTWVLEKQGDRWRIVHAHWSSPSRPEAEGR